MRRQIVLLGILLLAAVALFGQEQFQGTVSHFDWGDPKMPLTFTNVDVTVNNDGSFYVFTSTYSFGEERKTYRLIPQGTLDPKVLEVANDPTVFDPWASVTPATTVEPTKISIQKKISKAVAEWVDKQND